MGMEDINPEFVERYQLILEREPNSKVFAPLAEAYRKMGLHKEAEAIARQGVEYHPDFAGGRVALAKVYMDQSQYDQALEQLKRAIEISPENLLAQTLLGRCALKIKAPKDALKAFKMVLFLSPHNEEATRAVRKLESLTADEFEDDLFTLKPLKPMPPMSQRSRELDRWLSLADAFIIRNDLEQAEGALREAEKALGPQAEITKRFKIINQKNSDNEPLPPTPPLADAAIEAPPLSRRELKRLEKIEYLKTLLARVKPRIAESSP